MRTSEEVLESLESALVNANAVIREAHQASKDWKNLVKVERKRMEEIVREETARTIMLIAEDIRTVTQEHVDMMLDELRRRLLG